MSNYTDPSSSFKLIHPSDAHAFTKRNMKIWDMILNRLGLPDHLHEFVRGIYVSGNWDETEWEIISLMRIARQLTTDNDTQVRVYYRLKKNCPKFFEWQEQQSFTIIDREILTERAHRYKTKARYNFLLHDLVTRLFNLPKNTHLTLVKEAVDGALESYPKVAPTSRKPKKRKIKTVAKAIVTNITELIDLTGSPERAAVEVDEENLGEDKITPFAKSLLQIKNL